MHLHLKLEMIRKSLFKNCFILIQWINSKKEFKKKKVKKTNMLKKEWGKGISPLLCFCYPASCVLIFSDVASSEISFASVAGFFFTTASSLTKGIFDTSTSSFFNGIVMFSLDDTGSCALVCPLGGLIQSLPSHELLALRLF